MDNKRRYILMAGVLGLTFLWLQVVLPWLYKVNHWKNPNEPTPAAQTTTAGGPTSSTTTASGVAATGPAGLEIGAPLPPIVLGSTDYEPNADKPHSPYPLGLTLSNKGAALESVTLNRFKNQFDQPLPYVFQRPYSAASPLSAALATRGVTIGAIEYPLDAVYWQSVEPTTAPAGSEPRRTASFTKEIRDPAGQPLVRVTKTFELRDANDKNTVGYEILVTHSLANLTSLPLKARLAFNGTNSPKPENNRDVAEIVSGFDGGHQNVVVEHTGIGSVKDGAPLDIRAMKEAPVLWSGMTSAYFDALVRATNAAGAPLSPAVAKATFLNPEQADSTKHEVAIGFETGELDLPPNGSTVVNLNVYVGPKLRAVVKNDYYASFPLAYDETLVLSSGPCSVCTWPWLINILVGMLAMFHAVTRDWGLAIIALVCVVRLILHPVTKRSQISMSRMTKMGPEMERLKAKHKDDPDALKKAQMEFYREQGVAPFLGCLPMFLQMPIWIALWSSLQSTFEIRHASFLWNMTWIHDLSQPDRLKVFAHSYGIWKLHLDEINILPLLMGVVSGINQLMQPQPVAMNEQQRQQQQMMKYMTFIMFPLIFYYSPSGLNLYIFTSTLIGIIESKRIRDHIKEREAKEKAGVVIIDAPAGGNGKRGDLSGGQVRRAKEQPGLKSAVTGGIAGFIAKMHQFAEEAKREQEKQQKKGGKK